MEKLYEEPEFALSSELRNNTLTLKVDLNFDIYSVAKVREAVESVLKENEKTNLVFDFSDLRFIDSSGLGLLVSLRRRLVTKDSIKLVIPKESILKVFRITGLDRVFTIYSDLNSAKEGV